MDICPDCRCGGQGMIPSARITGDKDRENPVEGAPYGEGLIGRIDQLEYDLALARRGWAYAQDQQLRLMTERTDADQREADVGRQIEAVAELQLAAFLAGRGSVRVPHGIRSCKPAPTMDEFRKMARAALEGKTDA